MSISTAFWWGERSLGNTDIDGRIILKWIFREWNGGDMDCIDLALDRDR